MNNDDLFPRHSGGGGRLRALLQNLNEDQEKLTNDPRYKEGYDDGYHQALVDALGEKQNMKELIRMLIKLYDNDGDLG